MEDGHCRLTHRRLRAYNRGDIGSRVEVMNVRVGHSLALTAVAVLLLQPLVCPCFRPKSATAAHHEPVSGCPHGCKPQDDQPSQRCPNDKLPNCCSEKQDTAFINLKSSKIDPEIQVSWDVVDSARFFPLTPSTASRVAESCPHSRFAAGNLCALFSRWLI